ncbi:SPOR domain-containing protein [Cohnella yongneupensis]|uniref:SPOR domain-containing protein n=1 Tax=Cohnella yongneupensis TaxID=425006 RepID=A0ABW0R0D2_9BACL
MPSNARMTFRFEPLPAPKPVKPAQASQLSQTAEKQIVDALPIEPQPVTVNAQQPEQSYKHTIIESYPPMSGPYQDDIRALEEMIRRTDSVVVHIPPPSAIQEPSELKPERQGSTVRDRQAPVIVRELAQMETDFEQPERWSLPEEDGEYRPPSDWLSHSHDYVRKDSPSWTRVILSVAAAIATGALFGYMVLTLFTGEPMFPGKSDNSSQAAIVPTSSANANSPSSSDLKETASVGESVQTSDPNPADPTSALSEIKANEAYVLQYGVFRNADSTQLAAAQLKDVGLPAAIDDSDGYRVYAGIAPTRAEAELLAAQMPNIEVYIKPIDVAAALIIEDGQSQALKSFIEESSALSRLIAQLTVSGLQDELPQPLSQDDAEALQQAATQWKASLSAIDSMTGNAQAAGRTLEQSLNAALASLASYGKKTSRYHLWNAQSAIMQAELADRGLRQALQPATAG